MSDDKSSNNSKLSLGSKGKLGLGSDVSVSSRRPRSVKVSSRSGGSKVVELEVRRRNVQNRKLGLSSTSLSGNERDLRLKAFRDFNKKENDQKDGSDVAPVSEEDNVDKEKNLVPSSDEQSNKEIVKETSEDKKEPTNDEGDSLKKDTKSADNDQGSKNSAEEANNSGKMYSAKIGKIKINERDILEEKNLKGGRSSYKLVRDRHKMMSMDDESSDDDSAKKISIVGLRNRRKGRSVAVKSAVVEKKKCVVKLRDNILVKVLAASMQEKGKDVVRYIKKEFISDITIDDSIDRDTAELVIDHFGHICEHVDDDAWEKEIFFEPEGDESNLAKRPPVVVVMGHVDHGKTSLLDALRNSGVVHKEHGGITQHIGAYQVSFDEGEITFIDTPGHKAFTEMRARGAKATDIVVLVVAADDGIKEQTIEAIKHAQAADVPIIVAINKIDVVGADVERVKSLLPQYDLVPENFGGNTLMVAISAKEKRNLNDLVELIFLQSSMMDLKARNKGPARGVVVESKIDKRVGCLVTLLVQHGSLKRGDVVVAGSSFGKVKGMKDANGSVVKEATPSVAVEVMGFGSVPNSGDLFAVVDGEKIAREVAQNFAIKQKKIEDDDDSDSVSLSDLFAKKIDESKVLPLIIKCDVDGSVEAIKNSLFEMVETEDDSEVEMKILHSAVGEISDSDISLAKASNALILGFNVKSEAKTMNLARISEVVILYYNVIYELIDDVRRKLKGLKDPVYEEKVLGRAEVRAVFELTKKGSIAGCYMASGIVKKGSLAKLFRGGKEIYRGDVLTLRHYKENVREIKQGSECGIGLSKFDDIKIGDEIEIFELEEVVIDD